MQSCKAKMGISSIHRVGQHDEHTKHSGGNRLAEVEAVLTVVQIVFCVILLVAVFTLQFIDEEAYEQTGELYRAAMSGEGEAMYVSLIKDCTDTLRSTAAAIKKIPIGQGGEMPYLPKNLYLGRVLLSVKPAYPVYGTVTSPFGVRRHPISGKSDFHTGLDIAANEGDSIYATLSGSVAEVGYSKIYGNYIRITHGKGLESVYNHCSEILATEGAVVRRGERIALVGSTGVSTGSHLHFDLMVNNCYADPLQVFL